MDKKNGHLTNGESLRNTNSHHVYDPKISYEPAPQYQQKQKLNYERGDQYHDNISNGHIPPVVPPSKPPINGNAILEHLGITREELQTLIAFKANHESRYRISVFLLGVLFMPITLAGALIGYVRGYNRFKKPFNSVPDFYPLPNIVGLAMGIGIALAWVAILMFFIISIFFARNGVEQLYAVYTYLAVNTVLSGMVYGGFALWRVGIKNRAIAANKFGSARFARKDELFTLQNKRGYYIGQGHLFDDKGHILTVAGTRGGKGTNLIIPNLLDAGNIETSWVVIDPKGENAAVTSAYQRDKGQNVVILNPWGLLADHVGEAQSFNPLDMLPAIDDPNLVDDVQMIAEMIVPIKKDDHNSFFTDSARVVVSGLLMHLVTTETGEKRNLKTLWEWIRLDTEPIEPEGTEASEDDTEFPVEVFDKSLSLWDNLLIGMGMNETPVNGEIVQSARNEINRMALNAETFGSIMSDVLLNTDFLKSPPLQDALQSGFDPKVLAEGKTTVYVIIPADKLRTHSRWLRLVTTSLMRSVIRAPKHRVTFLLDEFAALGYMPEIETALSTYAGYNVTVWPILQTLGQLAHLYKDNWQTFIGNCTVRQYFSVNDNETAEYVSTAIGMTSHVIVQKAWFGVKDAESNQRFLITPDELRRESGKKIFMFIADLPPTYVDKLPYYKVPELDNRAEDNPYI